MRLTEVLNFVESIIENGKENNLGALKVSKGVCDFIDILRDQQCITKDSLKKLEYLLDYIPDIMDGKKTMQDALLNAIARSNDIEVKEEKEKKTVKVKSAKKAIVRKTTSYTYEESNWRCGGSSSYSSQTNWRC